MSLMRLPKRRRTAAAVRHARRFVSYEFVARGFHAAGHRSLDSPVSLRDDAGMRGKGLRRWLLVGSIVAFAACTKAKNATPESGSSGSAQHTVGAAPALPSNDQLEVVWDRTEPLCPRDKGPRKTSARLIGSWMRVIPQETGYAVQHRKPSKRSADHVIHVFDDAGALVDTIPGEKEPGSVLSFDTAAWYSAPCEEGACDGSRLRVIRSTSSIAAISRHRSGAWWPSTAGRERATSSPRTFPHRQSSLSMVIGSMSRARDTATCSPYHARAGSPASSSRHPAPIGRVTPRSGSTWTRRAYVGCARTHRTSVAASSSSHARCSRHPSSSGAS